jgi:Tfp pilus assembly protein PilX
MNELVMHTKFKNLSSMTRYPASQLGKSKQQGIVLFFALIALVIMSLAAVALIRSVDTNTIIAGNLASKQSAVTSADSGVETAITWMSGVSDLAIFNADDAAKGYYATQTANPTTFNWDASDSLPADDASGLIDANGKDMSGNTVRYVVQRMCRNPGAPAKENCLFGAPVVESNSQSVRDTTRAGAVLPVEQSPMYRITARVIGPRNTVSYIQAFVY